MEERKHHAYFPTVKFKYCVRFQKITEYNPENMFSFFCQAFLH